MTAPRQHAAAAHDVLFLVALGLMSVALIWLAAASRLAAVGVRMDRLCEQRVVLLHQRLCRCAFVWNDLPGIYQAL